MARRLTLAVERFPIAGAFTISRGSRTEIAVVVATIQDGKVKLMMPASAAKGDSAARDPGA